MKTRKSAMAVRLNLARKRIRRAYGDFGVDIRAAFHLRRSTCSTVDSTLSFGCGFANANLSTLLRGRRAAARLANFMSSTTASRRNRRRILHGVRFPAISTERISCRFLETTSTPSYFHVGARRNPSVARRKCCGALPKARDRRLSDGYGGIEDSARWSSACAAGVSSSLWPRQSQAGMWLANAGEVWRHVGFRRRLLFILSDWRARAELVRQARCE